MALSVRPRIAERAKGRAVIGGGPLLIRTGRHGAAAKQDNPDPRFRERLSYRRETGPVAGPGALLRGPCFSAGARVKTAYSSSWNDARGKQACRSTPPLGVSSGCADELWALETQAVGPARGFRYSLALAHAGRPPAGRSFGSHARAARPVRRGLARALRLVHAAGPETGRGPRGRGALRRPVRRQEPSSVALRPVGIHGLGRPAARRARGPRRLPFRMAPQRACLFRMPAARATGRGLAHGHAVSRADRRPRGNARPRWRPRGGSGFQTLFSPAADPAGGREIHPDRRLVQRRAWRLVRPVQPRAGPMRT